jgi:SPP1 gp7 family putative phage head morphogenesis protein
MATDPGIEARRKLLERERGQALRTVVEFKRIQARIADELRDVLERIEKTRRTEGNASAGQLVEQARLRALFDQVSDEIFNLSIRLGLDTSNLQRRAVEIAKDQAGEVAQLSANLDFFDGPATRSLIGIAGDGEPLAKHFANIAKPVRQQIFDALFYGVATGKPNSIIAQEINNAVGGGAVRAMTIARTETNRAYREASRKFYADVPSVTGWRWLAALDLTTCPICWSMHGRIFKTKTPFGTHPNCRCTMVPVFRGDAKAETGSAKFAGLTIEQQRAILGPKRLELYNQGAGLSDFVESYRSAFGLSRRLKNLDAIRFTQNPRTPAGSASGPPRSGKLPELKTPDSALSSIAPRPGDPVPIFATTAQATEYMDRRYPTTGFDFEGITRDGDILQKNVKELARLMDLYPEAAARLKYFGTYTDPKKIPLRAPGRFGSDYGHCARDGSFIALNPSYFGNREKIEKAKRAGREVGWSVSDDIRSTTTHEFGHAVEGWIDSKYWKSIFEFETNDGTTSIGKIKDAVVRKFKPKQGEQSGYSIEGGKREQFAEGFSMYWNRPPAEHSRFTIAQAKVIKLAQDSTAALDAEAIPWHKLSDSEQRAARKRVNDLYDALGLKKPYAKKFL